MAKSFLHYGILGIAAIGLGIAGSSSIAHAETLNDTTAGNNIPNVTYDSVTGQLTLTPDGLGVNAFLVNTAQSNIVSVVADPDGANGVSWSTFYVGSAQNWESSVFSAAGNMTPGTWSIATLQTGLTAGNFGLATFITDQGAQVDTNVTIAGGTAVPEPASLGLLAVAGLGLAARRRRTA